MTQEQLFPSEGTPPTLRAADESPLVQRRPGWVLMANRLGPQGFHVIKTAGGLGSVVSMCGITGRKVDESQRDIIECPVCAEAMAGR